MMINTRKLRYSGNALAAFKERNKINEDLENSNTDSLSEAISLKQPSLDRVWLGNGLQTPAPQRGKVRHIGVYALTSDIAPWVKEALASYEPIPSVLELAKPFSAEFHDVLDLERTSYMGFHDLDAIELTYQCTLEIGAAILLAADDTDDPIQLSIGAQLHASLAGGDDHFTSWGRLLTGLDCDPPITVQFPFYLMMCQAFSFEPVGQREDYIYSALTGVDWAKGNNKFNDRLMAFSDLALSSVPTLDDANSHEDRSFWRIALAYLRAMNRCENARPFKAPKCAAIKHDLDHDLVILSRAFDTIGSAYMCRDGAAWLDGPGIDSLIGSGLANDVMDLHTDIFTGETRNLLRLLYPPGLSITQAIETVSMILSSMLGEIFRGHYRARMNNREDGRVSSTSPPYSFSRARHRRIFETIELYSRHFPQFWEWTWSIYHMAKTQITEATLSESLACGLKRAATRTKLQESPTTKFFDLWYDMVEDGSSQLDREQPLGVSKDLASVVRDLHKLWHKQLLDAETPGWGREFDRRSDELLGEAGQILQSRSGISEDMYKFAIAFGRLSMGLPYIAYHTVDAIIMAFGVISPV